MENTEIERIELQVEAKQALSTLKKFKDAYSKSIDSAKIAQNAQKAANAVNKSLKTTTQMANKTVKSVSNMANKTVSSIKTTVNKTTKSITNALKQSIKIAKKLGTQFGKTFAKAISNTITKSIKGTMKVFKTLSLTLMKSIASVIKGSSNLIGKAFKGVFNNVNRIVASSIRGIINTSRKSLQGFSNLLNEVLEEKMELEINANVNSKGGKQKSSGGSGMASALLNAGMISSSLKTITSAIAKNNIGGLDGDIVAKFASKMIDAGQKTLTFGSFIYKAYRLVKQYWPQILEAFRKLSDKVKPVLKQGFALVVEAAGNLLSKGLTIVVNKLGQIATTVLPIVKNGFMRMINSAGNIFKKGIELMVNSNNPKIRALGKILQFIINIMGKLAPVLVNLVDGFGKALDVIAGIVDEMDFSGLADTISDVFSELATAIVNIASYFTPYLSNTVQALVDIFQRVGNSLVSVFKLTDKLANVFSPLGQVVAPLIEAFGGLVDILTGVFNGLGSLVDQLSPTLKQFVGLISTQLTQDIAKFSGFLKSISENLPVFFNAFNKAILPSAERFVATFSRLLLSVRGVFKAFKDTVVKFLNKFGLAGDSITEVMRNLGNKLGINLSSIIDAVCDGLDFLCDVLDNVAKNMNVYLTPVLEGLVKVFVWVKDTINACLTGLKSAFKNNTEGIKSAFKTFFESIKGFAKTVFGSFKEVVNYIKKVFNISGNLIGESCTKIANLLLGGFATSLDVAAQLLNSLSNIVRDVVTPALKFFVDIVKFVYDNIKAFVNGFAKGIDLKSILGSLKDSLRSLWEAFLEAKESFKKGLGDAGLDGQELTNVFSKLGEVAGHLVTKFGELVKYTSQYIGQLTGLLSTYLRPVVKDIATGIKWSLDKIVIFTKSFANSMKAHSGNINKAFDRLVNSIVGFGYNIWSALKEVVSYFAQVFGLTSDNIGRAGNKLASFIANTLIKTFDVLREAFRGLSYLLETTVVPVLKFFVDILKWVYDRIKTFVGSILGHIDISSELKDLINALAVNIRAVVNLIKKFAEAIVKILNALGVTQLIDFLLKTLGKVIGKLVKLVSRILTGILDLDTFIRDALAPVVEFLGDLFALFAEGIKNFITAIPEMIKGFVEAVKNFVNKLKDKFPILGMVIDGFVNVVKAVTWPFRKAIEVVTGWFKRLVEGMKKFFFWLRKNSEEKVNSHVTQDQKIKLEKLSESSDTASFNDTFKELYGTDVNSLITDDILKELKEFAKTKDPSAKLMSLVKKRCLDLAKHGEIIDGLFDEQGRSVSMLGDRFVQGLTDFYFKLESSIPPYLRSMIPGDEYIDLLSKEAKALAKSGTSILDESSDVFAELQKKLMANISNNIANIGKDIDKAISTNNPYTIREAYEKTFGGKNDLRKLFAQINANGAADVLGDVRDSLEDIYKDIPDLTLRGRLVNNGIAQTVKALKAYNKALADVSLNAIKLPKEAEFQANYFEKTMHTGIEHFLDPLTKTSIMDYIGNKTAENRDKATDAIKARNKNFSSSPMSDINAVTSLITIEKYFKALEGASSVQESINKILTDSEKFNTELTSALANTENVNTAIKETEKVTEEIVDNTEKLTQESKAQATQVQNDLDKRNEKLQELLKTAKRVNTETAHSIDFDPKEFEDIDFDNLKLPKDVQETLDNFSSIDLSFDEESIKGIQVTLDTIKGAAEDITIPEFEVKDAPKLNKTGGNYKPEKYKPGETLKEIPDFNLESIKSKLTQDLGEVIFDTVEEIDLSLSDAPEFKLPEFKEFATSSISGVVDSIEQGLKEVKETINKDLVDVVNQTTKNADGVIDSKGINESVNKAVEEIKENAENVSQELFNVVGDLQFPELNTTNKDEIVKRVFGGNEKFNPTQFVEENFDVEGIVDAIEDSLQTAISTDPVEVDELEINAPKITLPEKTTNEVVKKVRDTLTSSFKEIAEDTDKFVPIELGDEILDSVEDVINDTFESEPIKIRPINIEIPEIETPTTNTQAPADPIESIVQPTKKFSEFAKTLADNVRNAFSPKQTEEFANNISEAANTIQQQALPTTEQVRIQLNGVEKESRKVRESVSNMFQSSSNNQELDELIQSLDTVDDQVQDIKSDSQDIFNESEFEQTNASVQQLSDNVEELRFDFSGLADDVDEVTSSTQQLQDAGNQLSSSNPFKDFFEGIKDNVKTTMDAVDLYVDQQENINKILHPIKAVKKELGATVTKNFLKKTVEDVKALKEQFDTLKETTKEFKNSDLKGFAKMRKQLELFGQSAKLHLKQLKLTFKANAVGKLIEKMQGPVEKETRELAEKSPGGKENIGLFQGGIKKLALLFGGIGIGSLIKTATQEAISFEASMMQLNRRLGESVSILNDFASTNGSALGLSKKQIAEYGNIFSVYVSQFAKDADEMANTTKDLLQAAAITAQSTGYTIDEVMDSFRSGLTGSVESLDQYGINIKVAALESSAAFKEIANGATTWDQLTQAQQQQLISMNILSQVNRNFGSGVRNTNTILLQFQAALANVRLALGNTFKVILSAVLPPLTVLMQALEVVLNKVTQFVTALLSLFGIEVSFGGSGGVTESLGGVSDSLDNISNSGDGIGGTSDSLNDVGDAAGSAAEKAEELNKQLLGIDELNTIQTRVNSDSGSGNGGSGNGGSGNGGSGLLDGLQNSLGSFELTPFENKISESAGRMAEILKSIGEAFMEGWNRNLPYLQESLDNLEKSFTRLKEAGKNLFKDIWENGGSELVTNIGGLASALAGTIVDLTGEWLDTFAQVFEHLAPSNNPTTQYFLDSMNTFVTNVEELLLGLGNHFRNFKNNGGNEFINTIADIVVAISGFGVDLAGQAVKAISDFLDHLDPSNNPKTKKFIESMTNLGKEIEKFFTSAGGWFKTFMQNGGQSFLNNIGDIAMALGDLASKLGGDIVGLITDFMNSWVGQAIIEGIAKALEIVSAAVELIVDILNTKGGLIAIETFLALWATYKVANTILTWSNAIGLFCSELSALVTMLGGDLIAKIGSFFAIFKGATWLTAIKGALASAWSAISGAVMAALTAIAGFFGVSVGWIVAAIAAIVAAIVLIWKNWDEICAWCKKAWKKFCDWAPKAWETVCKTTKKLIDGLVKFFKDGWEEIKKIWAKVEDWAKDVKDNVLKAWNDFKSKLGDIFQKAWNFAKDKFKDAKSWMSGVYNTVIKAWDNFKSKLGDIFEKAWKFAKSKLDDAKKWIEGIYNTIIKAWDNFKSKLGDIFQKAWQFAKDKFNDHKTWMTGVYNNVVKAWDNFKSKMGEIFSNAWTNAKSKLNDAKTWITGIYNNVVSAWDNFKTKMGEIFSNAWTNAKAQFTNVVQWGQGIVNNIKSGISGLSEGIKGYFSTAWSTCKSQFTNVLQWGQGVVNNIKSGISGLSEGIKGYFSTAWSNCKSQFTNVKTWAEGIRNNIGSGISGLSGKITGYFSTAWSDAKAKFTNVKTWAEGIRNNIGSGFSGLSGKITGYFSTAWSR